MARFRRVNPQNSMDGMLSEGVTSGQRPAKTFSDRLEFLVLFLLLLPFYGWLLPTPGWPRVFGYFYLAAIGAYLIWFSPHRRLDPAGRRSLLEVPAMVAWSMFWVWVVLPAGPAGKTLGTVVLVLSAIYVLFFAGPRQGDTLAERGLGSPAAFWRYLQGGEHRGAARAAFLGFNLLLVAACLFAPETTGELVRTLARRSFGIRLHETPGPALLLAVLLPLGNLLAVFLRYDNLREAGKVIGCYLLVAAVAVVVFGYLYIYLYNGGWVVFTPRRAVTGIGAYALWGILQELLFLSYFNTRIRKGFDSPWPAALLTAIVFSIFHINAYTLMFICFLIGIVWAMIFQAAPNVIILGIAHGISGGFRSAFLVKGMELFRIKGSVGPFNL